MDGCALRLSAQFVVSTTPGHAASDTEVHGASACGEGAGRKLAVVVVDGLAMDQWAVVRQELPSRKWITEEFGLFAWVPTLTSVSRQSIFAGDPPFFFGQSLDTTRKEEQHWTRFWDDRGSAKATLSMPVKVRLKTTMGLSNG